MAFGYHPTTSHRIKAGNSTSQFLVYLHILYRGVKNVSIPSQLVYWFPFLPVSFLECGLLIMLLISVLCVAPVSPVVKSPASKVDAVFKEDKTTIVNESRNSIPNGFITEYLHISHKRKRSPSNTHCNTSSSEAAACPPSKALKIDTSHVQAQSQVPAHPTPPGLVSNGLSCLSPCSPTLPARRSLLDWDSFIRIPKKTRRLSLQLHHSVNNSSNMDHSPRANTQITTRVDPLDVKSSTVNPLISPSDDDLHQSKESKQAAVKSSYPFTKQTKHPKAISGSVIDRDWQKLFCEMNQADVMDKQISERKSSATVENNNFVNHTPLPIILEDFSDLECNPHPERTSHTRLAVRFDQPSDILSPRKMTYFCR